MKTENLHGLEDSLAIGEDVRLSPGPDLGVGIALYDPDERLSTETESGDGPALQRRCRIIFVDGKACLVPKSYFTKECLKFESILTMPKGIGLA